MNTLFKCILCLILTLPSQQILAQFGKDNFVYLSEDAFFGNYKGGSLSLNYLRKQKMSIGIGMTSVSRAPESRPADYHGSILGINVIFPDISGSVDRLIDFHFTMGKVILLNENGTIRANLSAGLGYTYIQEPYDFERVTSSFLFSNYTNKTRDWRTVSLILHPKVEFPISRVFGFSVAPMLMVNKDRVFVGVGFGTLLGLLRQGR